MQADTLKNGYLTGYTELLGKLINTPQIADEKKEAPISGEPQLPTQRLA
jgi:hypothetical protein